jgi:hypothetical protein
MSQETDKEQRISRRDLAGAAGAGVLMAMVGAHALSGKASAAPAKAKAIFFDVGGTILDWSAMPEKITKFFDDRGLKVDGKTFWVPWRTKLFFYMMYNSMIDDGFIPLDELSRRSTLALTGAMKIDLKSEDADGILALLGELDVYPDVMPGLQKMRELGYQLVPHTAQLPGSQEGVAGPVQMGPLLHIRDLRRLQAAPGHLSQSRRFDGARPVRGHLRHLEPVRRVRRQGDGFPDRVGRSLE